MIARLLCGLVALVASVAWTDAPGDTAAPSTPAQDPPPARIERSLHADQSNYLALLRTLKPGDTLVLEPGTYDDPARPSGLPVFDLHGTPEAPITITGPEQGPRPLLIGRAGQNTVRIANASHVVVRNLDIDGRDRGGDGVNGQGLSHHITLENLTIRGVGGNQQVVGISTNRAPAWNWTIRGCTIIGAGTGMYLGNSDGRNPFVAGVIERNLIRDTIGYNAQIKHQVPWPDVPGLPEGRTITIIRDNVFAKGAGSATGENARPNLLVGDVPSVGRGSANGYEIYRNFFYGNPTEALFQGEGNIAFYANILVNDAGPAISIQPHNGRVREVVVLGNTIVASGHGIALRGGDPAFAQNLVGNAVFASTPISGGTPFENVSGAYEEAPAYLTNPGGAPGEMDFYPRTGVLKGSFVDVRKFAGLAARDRDFNGLPRDWTIRGAYGGEGSNPGWQPRVALKP